MKSEFGGKILMKKRIDTNKLMKILESSGINKSSFLKFMDFLKRQDSIIIYGAGNRGGWLLRLLQKYSINVTALIDKRADIINNIKGIPVYKPDDNPLTNEEKEKVYILISTHYRFHQDIKEHLNELGYKNINTLQSLWYTGDNSFDTDISSITDRNDDFLRCAEIFEDVKSLEIYYDNLESYIKGRCIMTSAAEVNNQYFPTDITFNKGYSSFVDCGAYIGDTVEKLYAAKGKIDSLLIFEPDVQNYKAMVEMLTNSNGKFASNIFTYPCGVSSRIEQFKFVGEQGAGSWISEEGIYCIQCVSLDDVLINCKPTFIKMDIEGFEYEALIGSKRIIHEHKPDLSICVYHSIIDLCRIPLLIHSWNLGYRFYLRCHSDNGSEIVMYATCVS